MSSDRSRASSDANRKCFDQRVERVEQTFLSAHMRQTVTLEASSGHATTRRLLPTGRRTAPFIELPSGVADAIPRGKRRPSSKNSTGASSAPSRKSPQKPDRATTSNGSIEAAQALLMSASRQKSNDKGRQECLPHLHTHFLSSVGAGVAYASRGWISAELSF